MTNDASPTRIYPVGHMQGFVEFLPENGNYQTRLAVRNGSSIWHVPSALSEHFVYIVQNTPTLAEYDEWVKSNTGDEACDLSDLRKNKIVTVGLDNLRRNPLMFRFRPTGETMLSYDGGHYVPSTSDPIGVKVLGASFQFWIESFEADSVHSAIEAVCEQFDWTFEDVQDAVMIDMDNMLRAGSGRLEYRNLESHKGNWYFSG